MTERKVHQLTIAGLVLTAFLVGSFVGDWFGMAVLALITLVTLVGSLWPRADLVQHLVQRLVERGPALRRREPVDRDRTWRRARTAEGAACLLATGLVTAGAAHVGWGFDLAGWVLALLLAGLALLATLFDVRTLGAAIQRRLGGWARREDGTP